MFYYYFVEFKGKEPVNEGYFKHHLRCPYTSNDDVELKRVSMSEYYLFRHSSKRREQRYLSVLKRHKATVNRFRIKAISRSVQGCKT